MRMGAKERTWGGRGRKGDGKKEDHSLLEYAGDNAAIRGGFDDERERTGTTHDAIRE